MEAMARITGGVDTHLEVHVAAALNEVGGVLGTASFPTTAATVAWLVARSSRSRPSRNRAEVPLSLALTASRPRRSLDGPGG
jgi:hypothetical protein